jgi:hypothetical protein
LPISPLSPHAHVPNATAQVASLSVVISASYLVCRQVNCGPRATVTVTPASFHSLA